MQDEVLDLYQIYENLDKMQEMKRYKPPTHGYFPTVAEINTYARSNEYPHMIPFLLWLDECLPYEEREAHKEAIAVLREIVAELEDTEA